MNVQGLLQSALLISATLSCSSSSEGGGTQEFHNFDLSGTFGPAGGVLLHLNPSGLYKGTTWDRDHPPLEDFCWIPTPIVFSSGTWEPKDGGIAFIPEMALELPYFDMNNLHASISEDGMTLEGKGWELYFPKQLSQANTTMQTDRATPDR